MQVVGISFGSESKNDPVEGVLFYTAKDPFTAMSLAELEKEKHGVKVCMYCTKPSYGTCNNKKLQAAIQFGSSGSFH